ncbi:hypothetical protein PanWU01x14_311750, partial [Parasponia andersonii]
LHRHFSSTSPYGTVQPRRGQLKPLLLVTPPPTVGPMSSHVSPQTRHHVAPNLRKGLTFGNTSKPQVLFFNLRPLGLS